MKEREIFTEAIEKASSEQRDAFLDGACRDDPQLRARVDSLIVEHEKKGSFFLDSPAVDVAATLDQPALQHAGEQIGPYKLMEQIGEGGMGVVYIAVQQQPVKRKVALKIVKPGMDSKEVIARFEAERQALAMMDHPNIAKVLDAGTTESGRPYFVMELVKGIAITEYCDGNQLSVGERLKLFIQVCQAAQHAHQKGIIHRDLKPSNVLVRLHDEIPVPKVIDFGVAKALHHQLTDRTIYTRFAQVIGTPLYMSPEQAELGGVDIDTRTDVYSLGVLLYELLVGVTPFDKQRFEHAAYDEIRRIIKEDEPSKPSTRMSTLRDNIRTISQNRKTDTKKLGHLLRGELDWIVMKALEKDRTRRYETALGFASDVQRFLNEEPVLACPPSNAYRLRKFIRRNRGPVVAASAMLLLLCLGFVGTSIGLTWARREARNAQKLADQNQNLADKEQKARRTAEYGSYLLQTRLAAINLDQGNVIVARQELLAAPSDYRNWEWGYLVGLAWPNQTKLDRGDIHVPAPEHTVADYWSAAPAREAGRLGRSMMGVSPTVTFTNDNQRIVVGMRDASLCLREMRTGTLVANFPKLGSHATAVVFSDDERYLAAGNVSGDVFLFDTDAKELWHQQATEARVIRSFWFNPDQTRLVAADSGGVVHVFETEPPGRVIRTFTDHKTVVQSLRFLEDGKSVVSASRDGSVMFWELDSGDVIRSVESVPPHSSLDPRFVKISPNLREVAVGYIDGSISLWDRDTDENRDVFKGDDPISDLIFSHDGTCLFVAEGKQQVSVLDTAGRQINVIRCPLQRDTEIAVSADGARVATQSSDGIRVWAPVLAETGGPRMLTDAHDDLVLQAAFSPDGKRIVTASYDKTARVWDSATRQLVIEFTGHDHELLKAEFSPDGTKVASMDSHGIVRVWNAETGDVIFSVAAESEAFLDAASFQRGLRGEITNYSAVFSSTPFFERGLVVNDGKAMTVVDHTNGRRILTLEDNPRIGWPIIGPHGKRVATITDVLKEVHLWDLETGKKLHTLAGHQKQAYWAEFSPDGLQLVTSSMDGTAIAWDVLSGKQLVKLEHGSNVMTARFSPNGERIATASEIGSAIIWDASTGEALSTFDDHAHRLTNVEFSPDGTRVLTTAMDNSLRVWDPTESDARELVLFTRDSKLVYGTWSPDGRQILTCWEDGSVHLLEAFPWTESSENSEELKKRVRLWRGQRSRR